MSLFKTVNERRILNSPTEPTSKSWLWLKTENGISTLYDFVNGAWTPVNGFSDKDTGHGSEYGGDIYNDADYVTWNGLNEILDKNLDTVSTWLSGYLKEADLSNFITQDNIDTAVAESMNEALASYQKILTASLPLEIVNNKIRLRMGQLAQGNTGPVSGGTAYAKFQEVSNRLNDKQDKLVSGADIKTINGVNILDTSNDSNLQLQTPIDDLAAIRSGAAAGATAIQPSQLKTITIENTAYPLVGNGTIVIPNSGGGGGGTPVSVLNEGDEVPASGVYFFADSPSQVEGDYNSLLQTAGFSPGNLYYLSPAKRIVDGVEEGYLGYNVESNYKTFEGCTVRNNIIYYNGQSTGMKEYGDIIVSSSIKVADTSDTANISFMVSCPFAATSTVVRVTVVQGNATLKYLYSDNDWRDIPSAGFSFSSTGNGKGYTIRVTNTSTNYNSKRIVVVRLSNPVNGTSVDVRVVYPATRVFFKNGSWLNNTVSISDMQAYRDLLRANSDCRTEALTYSGNDDTIPIVGGRLFILHPVNNSTTDNPNNCFVGVYYNGDGTLTATVNGVSANVSQTETPNYYYVMIGNYKGTQTTVAVTASKQDMRSKTKTVTWSADYNDELPPIQSRYIHGINGINTDSSGGKYLSVGSGSSRQHCVLMKDVTIDLSKMNVFYVVSKTYSGGISWCDAAIYLKSWWGRFADDSQLNTSNTSDIIGHAGNHTGRSCMFENSFFLPSTQIDPRDMKFDIDRYGYWINKCYSTDMRRGGSITGDLYFSFLNTSGIVYEFGIITYDPYDL